jgi:hypothetical protein
MRVQLKAISVRICKKRWADSIKKLPPADLMAKSFALLSASLQLSISAWNRRRFFMQNRLGLTLKRNFEKSLPALKMAKISTADRR